MSVLPILAAILRSIKDAYFNHPFIFVFFTIPLVFTIASVVLLIVVVDDPENRPLSPSDEEAGLFSASSYSPSHESLSSSTRDLDTKFVPRSLQRKVSEANVEGLLAAHRERYSDVIWDERTYFRVDPRDVIQRVEEGDQSEDEDTVKGG